MVINNLIETHCHILPGIDDGAQDIQTSLKMIKLLQMQGAEKIIVTPHYYSDSISLSDFVEKRTRAFNELKSHIPAGSPEIFAGAEVYISKYLFSNDNLNDICIQGTKFAIIEHAFSEEFSAKAITRLERLICDYGITPVLAHIERYKALMDKSKTLDALIDMGCLTQVNISSFSDAPVHIRGKLFKYLESGRIDFIGSDCHNLDTRAPDYSHGAREIIKKCGENKFKDLVSNAKILLPKK
ncbi:MAG: hypothetical protein LIO43_00440 [Clostridiales bacterium]|nr:hypothetical protein [Clostridiales bacterium]